MPGHPPKRPLFRRLVVFVGAGSLAFSSAQGAGAQQRPDATPASSDQRAPITRPVDTPPAERRPLRP
ncbi:MAG: hypothetical protein QOK04_2964 [Solirubrobacteraceae bacterium]|jgi:hypothetical protein|nr:hypothetical protein [Solirubrobacteraceae bacterium]